MCSLAHLGFFLTLSNFPSALQLCTTRALSACRLAIIFACETLRFPIGVLSLRSLTSHRILVAHQKIGHSSNCAIVHSFDSVSVGGLEQSSLAKTSLAFVRLPLIDAIPLPMMQKETHGRSAREVVNDDLRMTTVLSLGQTEAAAQRRVLTPCGPVTNDTATPLAKKGGSSAGPAGSPGISPADRGLTSNRVRQ